MDKCYSREYCPPELLDIPDLTGTSHFHGGRAYPTLYKVAKELAPNNLWAEFGVGCGHGTTKVLRDYLSDDGNLHLFDSWQGIPDDWHYSDRSCSRAGSWRFPKSVGKNLILKDNRLTMHDGLFADTLPRVDFGGQLGLVHIDCDVYTSTRDVLFGANTFIKGGTVIIFDELIGYKNYRDYEYKALQEWLEHTGRKMEWHAKERFAVVGVVV